MCKESNNAPFAIGQRVIRIKPGEKGGKVGDEHIVDALDQCPKCKRWFIDIGMRDKRYGDIFFSVCKCGSRTKMKEPIIWNHATSFAPIDQQYTDISREIADSMKETAETPDIIKQPVLS